VSNAGVASVFAMDPPDETKDIEAPAYELLNGASIAGMPSKKGTEAVRLHAIQREMRIVDRAIKIAEGQVLTASIAAARESADEGLDQTRALHRQRALLLISLLDLNDKIEAHRLSWGPLSFSPRVPEKKPTGVTPSASPCDCRRRPRGL
jgi:hypothetical protein